MAVTTGEIEALYRTHASRLRRYVEIEVQTSDAVIEDACQEAWSSLLGHRDRVRGEGLLAWLRRTAVREALYHVHRAALTLPLEETDLAATGLLPHEMSEVRDRLSELANLPRRQQRLLWLHAAGFNYMEMARHEAVTRRTVERQLLRGKRALWGQAVGCAPALAG